MDVGTLLDAVAKLGLAVTMGAALWYFILSPRKQSDGSKRSSLLVPGWIHDDTVAEVERVRLFYEKALRDAHNASNARIQEWRGFRDEERAKRVDAENDAKALLSAIEGLSSDISLLLEIQGVAEGDAVAPKGARQRGRV